MPFEYKFLPYKTYGNLITLEKEIEILNRENISYQIINKSYSINHLIVKNINCIEIDLSILKTDFLKAYKLLLNYH